MDYRNPALNVPERVEDLIARMNLQEKVVQLCCCTLPHPLDDAALGKLLRYGMGTVSYLNSALSGDQQLKMSVSCAHASLELPGTQMCTMAGVEKSFPLTPVKQLCTF